MHVSWWSSFSDLLHRAAAERQNIDWPGYDASARSAAFARRARTCGPRRPEMRIVSIVATDRMYSGKATSAVVHTVTVRSAMAALTAAAPYAAAVSVSGASQDFRTVGAAAKASAPMAAAIATVPCRVTIHARRPATDSAPHT